jgi:hypothetical protein
MSGRGFTYRLESLIKLRSAERDSMRSDLQRAIACAEQRAKERDALTAAIARAELEVRALRASGGSIFPDSELRLHDYLAQQRKLREAKQREVDEAEREVHKAMSALEVKLQDVKALEKHRSRQHRRFEEDAVRAGFNAADDQWMRRKREGS